MLRVLQIIGSMNMGGAENFLMNVYRNIDREKIQFDFIVHRKGCFDDEIKELGGKIFYLDALQKVGPFKYQRELYNFFINHKEYKIIHSHLDQVSGFILEVAKKCNIPVRIAHSHSSSNITNNIIERLYKNYLNTKINKNATHFFACSDDAAKWLFKEKAKEAIIIKNAIDIDRFRFNEEKRKLIRKELNINENDIVIGHVGRFSTVKNHKFLINIFDEFQKNKGNAKLLLVGDGPLRTEIEKQIANLNITNKVLLVGNKNNVEDYYNAMDLFVFPSLYEGLPLTVIEAQINGLPIFISNTVSLQVDVTQKIKWLSLTDNWSEELLKTSTHRYNELIKIKENGYDIKSECERLEKIYIDFLNH